MKRKCRRVTIKGTRPGNRTRPFALGTRRSRPTASAGMLRACNPRATDWSAWQVLPLRPPASKAGALDQAELHPQTNMCGKQKSLPGRTREGFFATLPTLQIVLGCRTSWELGIECTDTETMGSLTQVLFGFTLATES